MVRRWLVVAQIAASLVLLVGTGLMARSFVNLRDADLGFEPEHVLTFRVALPKRSYPNGPSRRALYRELLGKLETVPGVIAAAGINNRPFLHGQVGDDRTYFVERQAPEEREENPRANGMVVSTNYFRAMNIDVIRGRPFTERDDDRTEPVIVISESLARQAWPAQDPIGKKLCCGRGANGEELWLTVVGVVENARYRDMYAPRLDVYEHYLQGFSNLPNFVVRTRSDPLLHARVIRQQLSTIEPRLSMQGITTMDAVMDRVFAPWRISSIAFGLFAAVAMALTGLGLFGILAFDVHRRTREIGIRVAFGATRRRIARLVATQAIGMVAIGALLGSVGGILLTRGLRNLLYGTTATHPTTYMAAAAVLFLVSSLATYFPARQATKADPWTSLRHE